MYYVYVYLDDCKYLKAIKLAYHINKKSMEYVLVKLKIETLLKNE